MCFAANSRPLVRFAHVLTEPSLHAALAGLGGYERSRYDGIPHKAVRARFLTGRILVRYALSDATGNEVAPLSWEIDWGINGKPLVTGPGPKFGISIAHTESMVAAAVCAHEDVGIDIECLDDAESGEPVVAALSASDQRKLNACRGEDGRREFIKLWTMKEAYAKWLGCGLGMDFGALDFDWAPGCVQQCATLGQADIHQRSIFLNREYFVALAARTVLPPVMSFQNLEARLLSSGACLLCDV